MTTDSNITTVQQIEFWRTVVSENQRLEFKEAKNTYDRDKVYGYCVALANESGGKFVLGLTNKAPRQVVGTKAFENLIKIADEIFQAVGFRVDVEEVSHPDGRVLVFHIPSRPRGTAYHLDGKYLMRSGESLTAMSEDRLRTIFAEGAPDWLEEYSQAGLSSQAIVDLIDTQAYFDLNKLPYPTTREAVIEKLKQERLIDELDGRYSIRRMCALLFAKRLEDFPDVNRKACRVVVYSGNTKLNTRMDQVDQHGYAVGFQKLVRFVMDQLPQNEVIQDALRVEVKLVPEIVVRELVANAIVHQDMSIAGSSMMVEIYDDRVEISNPGTPVVPPDRFIDGYQSRNERLASLMRRMGICEEKGSGIDKVVSTIETFQLPAPEFRVGYNRTSVTIYGPRAFDKMDRTGRIRACYQHCALKWVVSQPMSNQTLRERFGLPEGKSALVTNVINSTLEEGLIKPDEAAGAAKKFARYLPFWA